MDATDGYTAETGITLPTITLSKNGGVPAASAGTFAEIGSGNYYYEFTTGEIDTLGDILLTATKAGCRQFDDLVHVTAYDAYDAVRLGLSELATIEAKTALITSTGYTVQTPVNPETGEIALVAGDGYESAGPPSRLLTWTKTGYAGPTPTGTGTFRMTTVAAYEKTAMANALLTAAATVTLDAGTITIKVPLTETQTATLQPTTASRIGAVTHIYQLVIDTADGAVADDVTEYLGNAVVTRRITPAA